MYYMLLVVPCCTLWAVHSQQLGFRNHINKVKQRKSLGKFPSDVDGRIPGGGKMKHHRNVTDDWMKKYIDFEMSERKYIVSIKETVYQDEVHQVDQVEVHTFPGVLIENSVVIAICAHFHPYATPEERGKSNLDGDIPKLDFWFWGLQNRRRLWLIFQTYMSTGNWQVNLGPISNPLSGWCSLAALQTLPPSIHLFWTTKCSAQGLQESWRTWASCLTMRFVGTTHSR